MATSTSDREYLFIDGGCLRSTLRTICQKEFGDGDAYVPRVAGLAVSSVFAKTFYYDAVPGKDRGETQAAYEARVQPDHDRFDMIQALDRVHVALGKIVGNDKRQKGVDVRLAVDMMTYAFRGTMGRATLVAGDADFVPLLQALVAEGVHVTLLHPPQANAELKGAADSTQEFTFRVYHQCFSLDGRQPAFSPAGGASGTGMRPSDDGLTKTIEDESWEYAGRFREGKLRVWRRSPQYGESWGYTALDAQGATAQRALAAFDLINGWRASRLPGGWLEG